MKYNDQATTAITIETYRNGLKHRCETEDDRNISIL